MSSISKTDWARIDAMTDEDIDTSDIPPLTDEFFAKAKLRMPEEQPIAVPLDTETLSWLNSIEPYQILCLPENFERYSRDNNLLDSDQSINLSKLLKLEGLLCANSYDLKLDTKVVQRRSVDLWLGTIWILDNGVFPILKNVLTRIVTNQIEEKTSSFKVKKSEEENAENYVKLHITLKVVKGEKSKEINFTGNASEFFNTINIAEFLK